MYVAWRLHIGHLIHTEEWIGDKYSGVEDEFKNHQYPVSDLSKIFHNTNQYLL